ncbi:hypothetical protein KM043_006840 [Ampulex compressa]|nr:hypothetical protein KM043_006840 [Ampulex compressa]
MIEELEQREAKGPLGRRCQVALASRNLLSGLIGERYAYVSRGDSKSVHTLIIGREDPWISRRVIEKLGDRERGESYDSSFTCSKQCLEDSRRGEKSGEKIAQHGAACNLGFCGRFDLRQGERSIEGRFLAEKGKIREKSRRAPVAPRREALGSRARSHVSPVSSRTSNLSFEESAARRRTLGNFLLETDGGPPRWQAFHEFEDEARGAATSVFLDGFPRTRGEAWGSRARGVSSMVEFPRIREGGPARMRKKRKGSADGPSVLAVRKERINLERLSSTWSRGGGRGRLLEVHDG